MDLLRNAQKYNEKINCPGGVPEMIKLAQKAKKMIEINRKPPPNLSKEDKEPYNSSRDGEVYADEAYKLKRSKTIFKDFMTQKNKNLQTRDFDANLYMTRPNKDKGLLKIQRLSSLLEESGLGITEGPTIETSGPKGRQGTTFYYSWTWAKEFRRICGICTKPKRGWHHAFNKNKRTPLVRCFTKHENCLINKLRGLSHSYDPQDFLGRISSATFY